MYTPKELDEAKAEIVLKISQGNSLKSIMDKSKTLPCRAAVYTWLNAQHDSFDKNFLDNYVRARKDSADVHAERVLDVGLRLLEGEYDANSARVAIDAFKWTAGKMRPNKYGDRITKVIEGGDRPVKYQSLTEEEAKLLNRGLEDDY